MVGRAGLVTGAGRGLGRAVALALRPLARASRSSTSIPATADETVGLLQAAGGTGVAIAGDVSVEADVERCVAVTVEQFGALDFACNNAVGSVPHQPLDELDIDDARRMIDIALLGTALCLKHEVRAMRAGGVGGAVVNVARRHTTAGRSGPACTPRARRASKP